MPANNQSNKRAASKSATKKTEGAVKKPKAVVKKEVVKKPVKQAGGDKALPAQTRYFKIKSDAGECRGRFSGRKPKQAANKALTSILKDRSVKGDSVKGKVKFSIIECTRGSGCKQYNYVGERVKLRKPMTVTIGDKKIVYNFSNNVNKAAAPKVKKAAQKGGQKTGSKVANKTD